MTKNPWMTYSAAGFMILVALRVWAQPSVLKDLKSPDWAVRAKAVNTVVKTPALLASPEVRAALIGVVELENKIIETSFRAGHGVSNEFGEGYSEYYSGPLTDAVVEFAEEGDDRAAIALARGSYNPDSKLALILASYGEPLVSTMVEVASSDIGPKRWNGVAVLGNMLRLQRSGKLRQPLTAVSAEAARRTIQRVALNDPETSARREAVRALGAAGEKESLPVLEAIAATDPDDGRGHKTKIDFSVRAEARRAIAAIQAIKQ
jgi:HEAT repeat protein